MDLILHRTVFSDRSTIGELYCGADFWCHTLEDIEREEKVPGQTAIPRGLYEVVITQSKRFGRPLPILLGVPDFTGIRIHAGNVADHTEGCILVGFTKGSDVILRSRSALAYVQQKIEAALYKGKVWIRITGPRGT